MMRVSFVYFFFAASAFTGIVALAQDLQRDPTRVPGQAAAGSADAKEAPWGANGMSVVVRDGKPFLVVGTRLYAPGQKVGQFKLERITETEIWLLDGKELRKIPRYPGIQRKTSAQP